ncbi:hypothetical protein A4D02_21260 [Niastella koreensis]|uniref:Response regulator receiver protein n=2 Tax=Niastella koreensis TaxID=354356 RepID=G8TJ86_NIAKG|nr:response regulator [Niastella koreensis]AEV98619.1 response regulator receiver protein [Niastella koreensis GR20-10]OQP52939.1 hypothetical protein A4D02_21260 [Niastella koreensis]
MKYIILLVDDDDDEFDLFMEALHGTNLQCDCIFSKNAEKALHLLYYTIPDFIFIDYNMPKINGLKFITEIKKLRPPRDVPIILYSSAITDSLAKNAMALGAFLCIKKPYEINTLTKILLNILTKSRAFNFHFTTRINPGN